MLIEKQFGDIITFSRASAATRINPLGLIETVAANVPCIDYDPINLVTGTNSQTVALAKDRAYAVTAVGGTVAVAGSGVNVSQMGAASGVIKTPAGTGTVDVTFTPGGGVTALHVREVLGLSVWEQRTNLATYASDFTNAAWSKAFMSVTPNATSGLDGALNAHKLADASAFSSQKSMRQRNFSVFPSSTYAFSEVLKAGEYQHVEFQVVDGNSPANFNKFPVINLANGTLAQANGATLGTDLFIINMGNGWYRVTLIAVLGASTTSLQLAVGGRPGASNSSYNGTAGSGIYSWHVQPEQGGFATPVIPTSSAQVTRSADVPVLNTLSPFYKQSEGAILVNFSRIQSGINSSLISPSAGSAYGPIYTNSSQIKSYDGTNSPLTAVGNQFNSLSTVTKVAVAYSAAGIQQVVDGVAGGSSNSFYNSAEWYNGTWRLGSSGGTLFRSIKYFPKRLSNAQLQSLTA